MAAGAIALAAIASAHHDLAIDEPFTALAIAHPSSLGATFVHDNVPLYYLLLFGWTRVFGASAFALRALSMAAFAAAILFSAGTARTIAGARAGLLAGALVACSVTFGLQPAATARPYALLMMFAALALWATFRDAPRTQFAAHLLGLFTHPIFLFFSLAFAAATGASGKRRAQLAGPPLAAVAIYAVTWGFMVARTAALPATSWMQRPVPGDILRGLHFWGDQATPIVAAVVLVLVAVRGRHAIRAQASSVGFLAIVTTLVFAGTIGVSMVRPVYFASRTPVLVLPAVAIAFGILVAEQAPLLLASAVAALVAGSAIAFTARSFSRPDPFPTRASLSAVAPRMRCGDVAIASGLSYAPIVYYAAKASVPSCVPIRPFPSEVADHPGWLDETRVIPIPDLSGASTLWVFAARRGVGANAGAQLLATLSSRRSVRESLPLAGSFFDEIVVFQASGPSRAHP